MCRSPLAYGQATATRIFLGEGDGLTAVNHREWFSAARTREAQSYGRDPEQGGGGEGKA